jgi:hypothetical protein
MKRHPERKRKARPRADGQCELPLSVGP